jgi:Ca2+-binding EF-hand superfamily protein
MHPDTQLVSGGRRLIAAGLLMAALGAPSPAPAQQTTAPPPAAVQPPLDPDSPPPGGATLEHHIESLRRGFMQLDADFDGIITQRDVDVHVSMEAVVLRSFALQFVMSHDLDGDGTVTEDEIHRTQRYYFRSANELEKRVDDAVRLIMALDTNKDGKVSVSEAGKYSYPQMQRHLGFPDASGRTRRALALESGTKGEITLKDYETAGVALFRKVDTDGDGKISQQELDDYRKAR